MNKRPYNNIIERKLEQLSDTDSDLLWNDMHSILDKRLPQKKEKRRFIWWIFNDKGLLLMSVGLFIIAGSFLYFLSAKENSPIADNKSSITNQNKKINKDGLAKVLQTNQENIITINELNQKNKSNIFVTSSSTISVGDKEKKNFILGKTFIQPGEQVTIDQFSQAIDVGSNTRTNSEIELANLRSTNRSLHITPNQFKEKISLTQPLNTINGRKDEKGFYAGIMIGTDFSSVHFQSAKPGATTGFILGYALNQNWSIESGLLWDRKRVYDNGTYFNPPGYTPTNGIKIIAVNGKSRLHEWPVNVKYTVQSRNHSFFATTGLSSYFMKLENYDYEYTQNNQPGGHNYLSYKNETKDWFGVANLSVGYSHKVGNSGSIRIEPYLKLPIKNIGVANMPIMSTGLNFGFTKPLKR